MKSKFSLLLSTLAVVAFTATAFADAFTVNVKIGSADAGTSLTFGQGTETTQPFPPISLMFGVKDIYLANPANYLKDYYFLTDPGKVNWDSEPVSGDLSRLSVDLRTDAEVWVIVANSDATLYFEKSSGTPDLYWTAKVATSADETSTQYGELGDSLAVTAGNSYTIVTTKTSEESKAATVADDPENVTIYAAANSEGGFEAVEWTTSDTSATTIYVAATDEGIYFTDGTKYYSVADNSTSTSEPTNATSIITVDGATISSLSNYEVTLSGSLIGLTYQANSTSAKPFTTTVASDDAKISAITWIIKTFGTLDFDQNGVVNLNDAVFFYNFARLTSRRLSPDTIKTYAAVSDNLDAEAQAAYNYLTSQNVAGLALDGTEVTANSQLLDSAIYFYNYARLSERRRTAANLATYTTDPSDLDKAQIALEKIQNLDK